MYNVIFTIDYEIHGNGDGCPKELMIEPTYRMMKLFGEYDAKVTIMADVAEIFKFREYKEKFGEDKYYYDEIVKQLQYAVQNGHDVQLHIHSGYFNSEITTSGIKQNWEEYDFASLPYQYISSRIFESKLFLENLLQVVKPDYSCNVFRAANWSMIPTLNIEKALVKNGFIIDTSVYKYGSEVEWVAYDYSDAESELIPWFIDKNDVCKKDNNGRLLEIPIYCELRSFWHFVTIIRSYRMLRAKFHKHDKPTVEQMQLKRRKVLLNNVNQKIEQSRVLNTIKNKFALFVDRHPWKLDINQATGSQIIRAVRRIQKKYGKKNIDLPIVLIGHSKSFIPYNKRSFEPFLKFVANNSDVYQFSIFNDINVESFR